MSDERVRTAYHEAGHLVIGHVFRFPHVRVSIRPDEQRGSLGHVLPLEGPDSAALAQDQDGQLFYDYTTPEARERCEQWACSLYAGYAADVRISPETAESARIQSGSDDEQAEEALERVGSATDADRSRLREQTAALVAEHWHAIELLARELLIHEELDDVEPELIIEIARGDATDEDLERYRAAFHTHRAGRTEGSA